MPNLKTSPKDLLWTAKAANVGYVSNPYNDTPGWFDKWGFKCSNCQDAVNKRKIPGSICGDYQHERSTPDTILASKLNISVRTIRKKIKDGEIIGRKIPGGPYMILRKDNHNISEVLASF